MIPDLADGVSYAEILDAHAAIFEALRDEDGMPSDPPCAPAPELWFPPQGDQALFAKSLCAMCRAQAECLRYALLAHETTGVWGGVSAPARKKPATILRELSRIESASEL
jgi:hypothetical protein